MIVLNPFTGQEQSITWWQYLRKLVKRHWRGHNWRHSWVRVDKVENPIDIYLEGGGLIAWRVCWYCGRQKLDYTQLGSVSFLERQKGDAKNIEWFTSKKNK